MTSIQNSLNNTKVKSWHKLTTKEIIVIGMFAAVLTIISQISLPMPNGIPITIQAFGVALVGTVLGWKVGFLSTLTYILIGAIGLPVFSNFMGGLGVLTGMTGGYIIAWPVMAILCGIKVKTNNATLNFVFSILFSLIGLLFMEVVGALQWAFLSGGESTFGAIMIYSITMFIPKDIALTIVAVMIGRQIKKPLSKAGLII